MLISALLSLVGVGVGWLLNQASNLLIIRSADRHILKETVYFLLEFRHELRSAKAPEAIEHIFYQEYIKRVPGVTASEEEQQQVKAIGKQFAREASASVASEDAKKLRENFSACLVKLAGVDPVNAFRLKGKDLALGYLHKIEERAAQQMVANAPDGQTVVAEQLSKAIMPDAVKMVLHAALVDLEEVMMKLAQKIDRATYQALKKRLSLVDAKDEEGITTIIAQLLDNPILPAMYKQYEKISAVKDPAQ